MRLRIEPGALLTLAALILFMEPWDIALLLAAAVIHEAGHLAAIWLLGLRAEELSAGLGGLRIDYSGGSFWGDAAVALAGPIFSGIAAIMAGAFPGNAAFFAGVNLAFAVFNLIPLSYLDGGRALGALFGRFMGPEAADRASWITDLVCCAGLTALGALAALNYRNYTLILCAIYLSIMCCKKKKSIVE